MPKSFLDQFIKQIKPDRTVRTTVTVSPSAGAEKTEDEQPSPNTKNT